MYSRCICICISVFIIFRGEDFELPNCVADGDFVVVGADVDAVDRRKY